MSVHLRLTRSRLSSCVNEFLCEIKAFLRSRHSSQELKETVSVYMCTMIMM